METQELEKKIISKYGYVLNKRMVAQILNVSSPTIDRLISSSAISYFKVGNKTNSAVRFEVSERINFIERNKVIAFEVAL